MAIHEPHGDLIDRDVLFSNLDRGIETVLMLPLPEDFRAVYIQLITDIKAELRKCPVVIPASEEGE